MNELKGAPESQTDLAVSDNEIKAKQEEEKLEGKSVQMPQPEQVVVA